MTSEQIINIGPLAVALDRLVALGLILAFLAGLDWVVQRWGSVRRYPAALSLGAGLLAARIGYVWRYRESFALEPAAAVQAWLGGWDWIAGVSGAAIVLMLLIRHKHGKVASVALVVSLAFVWWTFSALERPPATKALPPEIAFGLINGKAVTAADLRGQPAVVNLWATWCPPCRRELPMLVRAAASQPDGRILLVDQGEAPDVVREFLAAQSLPADAIALDPDGALSALAGAQALPTTLFVDSQGVIRKVHLGEISRVQLDIAIRELRAAEM